MGGQTYNLQVLVYDATLNYSRWAILSFAVAADNSVTGTFEYSVPTTNLVGKKIAGTDGSKDDYELDGGGVSIRFSSYPAPLAPRGTMLGSSGRSGGSSTRTYCDSAGNCSSHGLWGWISTTA